jgi:hypothetical protein
MPKLIRQVVVVGGGGGGGGGDVVVGAHSVELSVADQCTGSATQQQRDEVRSR